MQVSIIGCGNLGRSFLEGLLKTEFVDPKDVRIGDPSEGVLKEIRQLGVETFKSNNEAVEGSEIIFLAVKPGLAGEIVSDLGLSGKDLLISLAAGVTTESLQENTEARIVRVMPNICASTAEMASAYSPGTSAEAGDEELVDEILSELGKTIKVREEFMDLVTGLSGSGPAFVFMIVQALQEVGEQLGLNSREALLLGAQTIRGSAELIMSSGKNLNELIDMVCSPKGTTIEGVKVLEEERVQDSLKEAVKAAVARSKELSK